MIPHPWAAVVLALGAYRLTRLIGWDTFPPVAVARAWILGETWPGELNRMPDDVREVEWMAMLRSDPELAASRTYVHPLLADLVSCPFCLGWWVALATYAAWLWLPTATLYAMSPLALAAAVGLVAKNLDE